MLLMTPNTALELTAVDAFRFASPRCQFRVASTCKSAVVSSVRYRDSLNGAKQGCLRRIAGTEFVAIFWKSSG
jgi:hypothetical protein